jgi:hypothetical protein
MSKLNLLFFTFLFFSSIENMSGQEKHYFYNIPKSPDQYTAENVSARMVDGLGFRYYWATDGLRPEDLAYEPNDEARSTRHTLEHIYDLTNIVKHTSVGKAYSADTLTSKYSFEDLRSKTLENLEIASKALKSPTTQVKDIKMQFKRPDGSTRDYEFWYLINGPIADALWHVGQVVSFRRSSGNPLPKGVNVLQGTKS